MYIARLERKSVIFDILILTIFWCHHKDSEKSGIMLTQLSLCLNIYSEEFQKYHFYDDGDRLFPGQGVTKK